MPGGDLVRHAAPRRRRRRRGDRRRRLHRPVDGAGLAEPTRAAGRRARAATSGSAPAAATADGARPAADEPRTLAARHGKRRGGGDAPGAMHATVDEVGRVVAAGRSTADSPRAARSRWPAPPPSIAAGPGGARRARRSVRRRRLRWLGAEARRRAAPARLRGAPSPRTARRSTRCASPRPRSRGRSGAGCGSTSTPQCRVDRAAPGDTPAARSAPRSSCAPPRPTRRPRRPAPRPGADLLADDRHRAAAGASGTRSGSPTDRRSTTPATDHLRPAHRRRPHRVRRAGRAVPLRFADRPEFDTRRNRAPMLVDAVRELFPARRRGVHPPLGRAARRAPRLAALGALRPRDRHRRGRRLCGRRRRDDEPRRTHAGRPDHRR